VEKKKGAKVKEGKDLIDVAKEGDNISTLREILFGNKIAEYEKRFKDLEEHLSKEITSIREEVDRLFKSLENFFKDELNALSARFKEEQEERQTSDKRIREDIDNITQKFTSHKEENSDAHRDLRQLLLDRHKELSDDMQQLKREMQSSLDNKSTDLDGRKVDRLALADLLTEMALQLGRESGGQGDEQ
jgi:gas vesicle protein